MGYIRISGFRLEAYSLMTIFGFFSFRSLFRGLLMTACDLGAITKPWPVQKKVARLVAVEFFQQGDLERRELKVEPIDMMNREKIENLPSMQVDFINAICTPIYKSFNQFSEGALQPMVEGVNLNHIQWSKLADSKASVWSEDEEEDEIQDMAAA